MVLSDLYVGIAQTGKATLFNQTLLPVHFTWRTEVGQNCTDLPRQVRLKSQMYI